MKFEFRKMTDEEAQEIAGWHCVPPYDFYDWVSDPDDLAELLDPRRCGEDYFSAFDEKGALVGPTFRHPNRANVASSTCGKS